MRVGCPSATLKERDVDAMIVKHFGQWRNRDNLQFYVPVLARTVDTHDMIEKGYGAEADALSC